MEWADHHDRQPCSVSGLQRTGACSSTSTLGQIPQRTRVGKRRGASAPAQPLLGRGSLSDKIKPTAYQRLDLIPSEVDLCGAEIELAQQERHLHRFRGSAESHILESGRYDVVLIIPPSLGVITLMPSALPDYLLVPLPNAEYYALEGSPC